METTRRIGGEMTDHHVHIVRKLRHGESMPRYSTAALLFGCTFPTVIDVSDCAPDHYTKRFRDSYTSEALESLDQLRDKIKEMIEAAETNDTIAAVIDRPQKMIKMYIKNDPELRELSFARRRSGKKVVADRYFAQHRDTVVAMLKDRHTLTTIGNAIGLSLTALDRRVRRDPELMKLSLAREIRKKK